MIITDYEKYMKNVKGGSAHKMGSIYLNMQRKLQMRCMRSKWADKLLMSLLQK